MGHELEWVPPFVILSACSVAPRGASAVTITDILLRQGAFAVLGTLVPISVNKNATLMVRFFTYIFETLVGNEQHRSLEHIWHHVATSNAVVEVLAASSETQEWGYTRVNGESCQEEFMMRRSSGRLKRASIYADTEDVLREIADERGFGKKFRSILSSQGYFPESLLYVLQGRPDRIVTWSPEIEMVQAAQRSAVRPSAN
jgi:hypothetical protein